MSMAMPSTPQHTLSGELLASPNMIQPPQQLYEQLNYYNTQLQSAAIAVSIGDQYPARSGLDRYELPKSSTVRQPTYKSFNDYTVIPDPVARSAAVSRPFGVSSASCDLRLSYQPNNLFSC